MDKRSLNSLIKEVRVFKDIARYVLGLGLTQAHLGDTPFSSISRENCAIPHNPDNPYPRN